jgi:hypothetical protein
MLEEPHPDPLQRGCERNIKVIENIFNFIWFYQKIVYFALYKHTIWTIDV